MKRYEVLKSLPAYGPMYIPVSETEEPYYSEGFPVRFYKSDGTSWVANFKPGWTELVEVFALRDTVKLLIVAKGNCYLMDPDEPKPMAVFGGAYTTAFLTHNGRIVLGDDTELTIVETDGKHWHSGRISWDGLKVSKLEGNMVSGFALDLGSDEWVEFTYDIDSQALTGGSYGKEIKERPWWKLW